MQRFPIPPPTWAEYRQNQEYYDHLYQGPSGSWYNHNTAVPGFVELPGDCVPRPPAVNQASSSRAGPIPNNPTMHCDKQLGKDCNKACCKLKPKARGRRVTIATASDEENGVVTDTEGNITDSSNPVVKSKTATKAKGKDKAVQTESENESSDAQADGDASTDAETSVLSSVACLKDPKWSLSEDCRLRSMKEAGETWAFISGSLCKTKDDVRARWKILRSQLLAKDAIKDTYTDTDTDNAAEEVSVDDTTDEDGEDDEESAEDDEDSGADGEDSDDDEESDEDDEDSDDDEESDESDEDSDEDSDDDANKISKSTVQNKWHKGERNLKVARENRVAKAHAQAKASGSDGSSTGEAKESDEDSSLFRGNPEKQQQMKHLQEHVYGAMYPPHIYPQPNAYLVKRDCALLATIDSKYKRSRWLEMQANFYNVTGQMIPLVSFKARFERAGAEKSERSKTRELEKRMNKVEDWIAKQEREKSADSEDSNDTEDSDDSDE
ncbi:hypothetical protein H9Q72_001596 [Fusarium xylarioides]|uniref:Myb-like domain-containing protein n=1 Tax=Fusarium xylarioides TaxID=221167 RepID=A0A9P7I7X2_9HYPO|nr:hypothetical protein H9Q72_001596 [Fusarium xylarioides]